MGSRFRQAVLVGVALLAVAPSVARAQEGVAPEAGAYLARALAAMQANYYLADAVDWPAVYERAFREASGAEVAADTYGAIRGALAELSHSFAQFSEEALAAEDARLLSRGLSRPEPPAASGTGSPFSDRRDPEVSAIPYGDDVLGHVVIPAFGGSPAASTRFAQALQDGIKATHEAGACGWIVDLRGNGGGNMWPMLVGVGPVLGEGILGSFQVAGRHAGNWFYRDGVSGTEGAAGFVGARLSGAAFRLETAPPVAVLIDGGTGSSGEATAIAFKGREHTRFFGTPSAGYSTSTQGFPMGDGVNLVVAVGVDVDRDGTPYPAEVRPDVAVTYAQTSSGTDTQLGAASEWLAQECRR